MEIKCPDCHTYKHSKKNGSVRGTPKFWCKKCERSYTSSDKYVSEGKGKFGYDFDFKLFICWKYEKHKEKGGTISGFVRDMNEEIKDEFNYPPIDRYNLKLWFKKYEEMNSDIESKGWGETF